VVAGREETNVRLPQCALDALARISARRGVSRDEAVRQVLDEHLELQEKRKPDDRWTHISTVLRYPAPPRWRKDPRTDQPLRLRLASGVAQRARAVSLRLPGQAERAHRDYQARLLTDAVMTAIAVQEPFTDEFLDGLMPLLRHGAAVGLWRLAVAATSTAPENAIHDAAENARSQVGPTATPPSAEGATQKRLLLVAEALDEDVAWHARVRFTVAANLARDMLSSGAKAHANEQMLHEQGSRWNDERQDLRYAADKARPLRGTPVSYDWSGRGGAAVWRAHRRVELQDFEVWLMSRSCQSNPVERRLEPPGWLVRTPGSWCTHVLPARNTEVPEPFATWVSAGRLLTFPAQEKQVLWPLTPSFDPPGWEPVPGIEPVIAAAGRLRPEQISGFIEAVLLDWGNDDPDHRELVGQLHVPVHEAFGFGFIDANERRRAMAEAREATLQGMTDIIDRLPEHERHHRAELEAAMGDARLFTRLAARFGIKFSIVKATWVWPLRSVTDEVLVGTRADAVEWLARWVHKACARILQESMEQAWHDAFDHHPATYWRPETPL
jgi:hypothetical protein